MANDIIRFRIDGMTCAACSARSERALGMLPDVESVSVSLAGGMALIRPAKGADADGLIRAVDAKISSLGFTPSYISPETDDQDVWRQEQGASLADLARRKKRLAVEFTFALPLLIVAMGAHWGLPLPLWLDPHHSPLAFALFQLALTVPVVWSGRDFYRIGLPSLLRGTPNMDSLVAVGTGAALLYSLWSTVEIALQTGHGLMGLYYESAAVLIALISLGKYLEARSRLRTSDAIKGLMDLTPETVALLPRAGSPESPENAAPRDVSVSSVLPGDRLLIRPGTRIPVDGVVEEGSSALDLSSLTGESLPVDVGPGDSASAGAMNLSGAFVMEARRVGADTTLARVIRLVREAQGSKAPIAGLADRISLYFVPTVMVLATLAGLAWHFAGGLPVGEALRIFVAVLVVACPCALGLATPMSIMVGTGRGAQLGVLIKNGDALERAGTLDTLIFDKTGTLTEASPRVVSIAPAAGWNDASLLRAAAALEAGSEHPLARAVLAAARGLHADAGNPDDQTAFPETAACASGCERLVVENFQAVGGRGVRGTVDNAALLLGNPAFLRENNIALPVDLDDQLRVLADQGQTPLLLAADGVFAGHLGLADPLRPESPAVVQGLKERGINVLMLSGDQIRTAKAIARAAGIENVAGELLPADKEKAVAALQDQGRRVGMVGDGINDAPALARADVGMAMGSGIDIAMDAGDMVLLRGLPGVLIALDLSRATLRNIKVSLFWAFAYNIVLIPVAAGVLLLFGGPAMSPMLAGAAMAASSVSVVTNALRLRNFGK